MTAPCEYCGRIIGHAFDCAHKSHSASPTPAAGEDVAAAKLDVSSSRPSAEDVERLNKLERMRATVYRQESGAYWVVVDETARTRTGIMGPTLRAAIDAVKEKVMNKPNPPPRSSVETTAPSQEGVGRSGRGTSAEDVRPDVAGLVGQLEKIIGAAETKTMPYSYSPDWVYLHAMDCLAVVESQTARIATLEDRLFALGEMDKAPCFVCGYNGPGYFQPEQHPCEARRRALASAEQRG